MSKPFISICIPAYKRVEFLQRLLGSIEIQEFRDFEVVITDDSGNEEVANLCKHYQDRFPLHYYRNSQALGTPENWNESIRRSNGQWIKLMHDDDWFSSTRSLSSLVLAVKNNEADFYFSAYWNVYEDSGRKELVRINDFRKSRLKKDPFSLLSSNVIGPPSVTLVRRDINAWYDKNTKWVVDIDYYMRVLPSAKPFYINDPLINVGINSEQVTRSVFRNPSVEIPEHFYLLEKTGIHSLDNILVYDAWWRLIRNLKIDSPHMISNYGYQKPVHPVILSMIGWQKRIPRWLLHFGVFSKIAMFLHYISQRKRIK